MLLEFNGVVSAVYTPRDVDGWTAKRMPLTLIISGRVYPVGCTDPRLVDTVQGLRCTYWVETVHYEQERDHIISTRDLQCTIDHTYIVEQRDGKRYASWQDTVRKLS
jgi:hypothetical protein